MIILTTKNKINGLIRSPLRHESFYNYIVGQIVPAKNQFIVLNSVSFKITNDYIDVKYEASLCQPEADDTIIEALERTPMLIDIETKI